MWLVLNQMISHATIHVVFLISSEVGNHPQHPCCRHRKWGPERWGDLSKVTDLESRRSGIWTQICLTPKPRLRPLQQTHPCLCPNGSCHASPELSVSQGFPAMMVSLSWLVPHVTDNDIYLFLPPFIKLLLRVCCASGATTPLIQLLNEHEK